LIPITLPLGDCLTCKGFNATAYKTKNGVPTDEPTDVIEVNFQEVGEADWAVEIVASTCKYSHGRLRYVLDYSSYGPPPSGLSGSIGISCLRGL
jgi:hypothetical protein